MKKIYIISEDNFEPNQQNSSAQKYRREGKNEHLWGTRFNVLRPYIHSSHSCYVGYVVVHGSIWTIPLRLREQEYPYAFQHGWWVGVYGSSQQCMEEDARRQLRLCVCDRRQCRVGRIHSFDNRICVGSNYKTPHRLLCHAYTGIYERSVQQRASIDATAQPHFRHTVQDQSTNHVDQNVLHFEAIRLAHAHIV